MITLSTIMLIFVMFVVIAILLLKIIDLQYKISYYKQKLLNRDIDTSIVDSMNIFDILISV